MGVNGILNRFLRVVAKELLPQLTRLFQIYIDLRYYLKEFKIANMIVLRKPGKDNYLELKSYRLIALLSTIGKTLKTIIVKRLSDYVEKYNLLFLE